MTLLQDMYGACLNVPAIVIGGGPSAPEDYAQAIKMVRYGNVVKLSANHHGHLLAACAWTVCVDQTHTETKEDMEPLLRKFHAPIIGLPFFSDVRINGTHPNVNSGMTAIYVAYMLGCSPIYLCGFDCYRGNTYWHDTDAPNMSLSADLGHFLSSARKVQGMIPGALVVPVSGPLREVFAVPEGKLLGLRDPLPMLQKSDTLVPARFIKDCRHMAKVKVKKGEEHMLTETEFHLHYHKGNVELAE